MRRFAKPCLRQSGRVMTVPSWMYRRRLPSRSTSSRLTETLARAVSWDRSV